MKGDRADDIIRADAVQLAFIQLQAHHSLFMRPIASTLCTAFPGRYITPPERVPFSSAREVAVGFAGHIRFYVRDLGDGAPLFIRARHVNRSRDDDERDKTVFDEFLYHFEFAFITIAPMPDHTVLND